MSDQYRQRIKSCQSKIADLQKEKGSLAKKAADLQGKISSASESASRTKIASMQRMKLREVESKSRDLATTEGKIAAVEGKLASEYRRLGDAQQSLAAEEKRESEKRQRAADRATHAQQQRFAAIGGKLIEHDALHVHALAEIDRLKQLPEEIVVLFLASNPLDENQLRLDEECRAIQETIRKAKHRDSVHLKSCWAVRALDVMQALNEANPQIVHFSGHGSANDEIIFQDNAGQAKPVSMDALVQIMKSCAGEIRVVFFNTCFSRNQAAAIVDHVEAAVGMNDSIDDE
ncbi:MAG: hypothetical protein IT428_11910, partial [Planctomycetaceae bacterium]|nr:hypothetical protein [Planctomycetaceae bacterium]